MASISLSMRRRVLKKQKAGSSRHIVLNLITTNSTVTTHLAMTEAEKCFLIQ